jgi:hypothetical protein
LNPIHSWGPADYVMVIGAVFTGLCSLVAAIRATKSDSKATTAAQKSEIAAHKADIVAEMASDNSDKLDSIHRLTDGNLTKTQDQLEQEKRKNSYLEDLVIELTTHCGPNEIERAKRRVLENQAKIGKRRKTDIVGQEGMR